ncbi:MAG: hypothetical protein ACK4M7_01935 [Burkholderiales bacterium]
MAILTKHFDTLEFVQKSKELGVPEKVAEYQARQFEQAIEIAISTIKDNMESKELSTKTDIKELEFKIEQTRAELFKTIEQTRAEIFKSKYEIIIWVAGLLTASGIVQHFFK